jgi:hypothetical protein
LDEVAAGAVHDVDLELAGAEIIRITEVASGPR